MNILRSFFVRVAVLLLIITAGLPGCATITGPSVSREEVEQARKGLEVKAIKFRLDQIKRVNKIGYHLLEYLPPDDIKVEPRSYLGLFCLEREEATNRLFEADEGKKGVFIAFVLENSPAAESGIQQGDLLLSINGTEIKSAKQVHQITGKLKAGEDALVSIRRGEEPLEFTLKTGELPADVSFTVIDDQSVNAAAGTDQIFVTYGLLNFAKSDDEIAAVMGHELAHLARKHVRRSQGSRILAAVVAVGLGITAEVFSPGSGDLVMRGVGGIGDVFNARFSRDLEREADYFGLKFIYIAGYDPHVAVQVHERFAIEIPSSMTASYFSTHPSSPERTVRLQKAIDEFQAEGLVPGQKVTKAEKSTSPGNNPSGENVDL